MFREIDINGTNPFLKKIEYLVNDKVVGYLSYLLIYDKIEVDNNYKLNFDIYLQNLKVFLLFPLYPPLYLLYPQLLPPLLSLFRAQG